jgi:hypothetical protein
MRAAMCFRVAKDVASFAWRLRADASIQYDGPSETQMAIPGYQDFMLPLLKLAGDGQEHKISDAIETLAKQLSITEEEQELMLPSGTQTRLYNRLTWAVTYLTKSLLLGKAGRGRFKIAPRGLDVLKQNPPRVDNSFLDQFPEYKAFKTKKNTTKAAVAVAEDESERVDTDITPDEQLDVAYKELRETLADELLSRVRAGTPSSSNTWWLIFSWRWATADHVWMPRRSLARAVTAASMVSSRKIDSVSTWFMCKPSGTMPTSARVRYENLSVHSANTRPTRECLSLAEDSHLAQEMPPRKPTHASC